MLYVCGRTCVYLWKGQGQLVEVSFLSTIWNLRLSGTVASAFIHCQYFFFLFHVRLLFVISTTRGR